jgi:hypothetical protein
VTRNAAALEKENRQLRERILADATRIAELERLRWPDGRPAASIPEMSLDNQCEPEICRMLEDWHDPAVAVEP